jgi:hypothetical protein
LTDIRIGDYLGLIMASTLRSHLQELASSFASSVLHAIRTASIEDLLSESGGGGVRRPGRPPAAARAARAEAPAAAAPAARAAGGRRKGGRLARRNAGDIAEVIDRIVGLLKSSPKGLRAEEIRAKLGLQSKELPRPLKEAVEGGRLSKAGQKRATTYFLKGAGGGASPAASKGKAASKSASKSARKK